MNTGRREFAKKVALTASLSALLPGLSQADILDIAKKKMKMGLVTYLWGKDWDVPTLITNCTAAEIYGVELRVDHAHGVTVDLSKQDRAEVKKRFQDSKVEFLGMGTNEQYDSPDPVKLKNNMDRSKQFIQLSHDLGGTGVKVKPNQFHKEVEKEKTIEQIGKALRELAIYGEDYGQIIRLEVHGNETQELPNIKAIMDVADHPNARVCWNCNNEDLIGEGLEYNFNLVKANLGDTVHIRELNVGDYPYQDLFNLFVKANYGGWVLLECRTDPQDKVVAMKEQLRLFNEMIKQAKGKK
ncbi:MAG: sugar phosphate isomerase/epimerase [Cyclobacteriaceae bacterium]|nr:sugar phosphate isomerase/epimerase [Cyclobacteriaceae bacterium]